MKAKTIFCLTILAYCSIIVVESLLTSFNTNTLMIALIAIPANYVLFKIQSQLELELEKQKIRAQEDYEYYQKIIEGYLSPPSISFPIQKDALSKNAM